MATIGRWKETEQGLQGEIFLSNHREPVTLSLIKNEGKDGPDYHMRAENGAEVGAAFERIGERSGNRFLSCVYDNALEPSRVDFNLIDRGEGNWEAIHSRNAMTRGPDTKERGQESKHEKQASAKSKDQALDMGLER